MKTLAALAFLGLIAWAPALRADLGDTPAEAEARSEAYKTEFGALRPLLKADAKGRIHRECWHAPLGHWTKDQALEFVQRLVPAATASGSLAYEGLDGNMERYVYSDGTVAILYLLLGKYSMVEVRTAEYTGYHC